MSWSTLRRFVVILGAGASIVFLINIQFPKNKTTFVGGRKGNFTEEYALPASQIATRTAHVIPDTCDGCFQVDFEYILEPKQIFQVKTIDSTLQPSSDEDTNSIDLLILIDSVDDHQAQRNAIRETWASISRNDRWKVSHVFLLGVSRDRRNLTKALTDEHIQYQDIVQADFVDTYSNLTLKTKMGLQWATSRCAHARYVMKTDDDMWLNIPSIMAWLDMVGQRLQTAIGGNVNANTRPYRGKWGKYDLSVSEYPHAVYPNYCAGRAYVTSMSVAKQIVNVSNDIPFFKFEDVYIGLCIQALGYSTLSFPVPVATERANYYFIDPCRARSKPVFAIHDLRPHELRHIWTAHCGSSNIVSVFNLVM
jgi:hypothetical protein